MSNDSEQDKSGAGREQRRDMRSAAEAARAAGASAARMAAEAARRAKSAADRAVQRSREAIAARRGQSADGGSWLERLASIRPSGAFVVALAIIGPVLALLTQDMMTDVERRSSTWYQILILLDICYLIALMALVGLRIADIVIARRARSAGSRLHGRMVALFIGVAAIPTALVAVVFLLIVPLNVNAWFNKTIEQVVEGSKVAAVNYERDVVETMRTHATASANGLNNAIGRFDGPKDRLFAEVLDRTAEAFRFKEIFVLGPEGDVLAVGLDSLSYLAPKLKAEERAKVLEQGVPLIRRDAIEGRIFAVVPLDLFDRTMLVVAREFDPAVIETQRRSEQATAAYLRLEADRDAVVTQGAALYLGFALLVLVAAIYAGLWFAERLAKPIGRLAAAAQRVRSGDLVTRVKEEKGDDEIALLSRVFNRMTEEVQRKQEALKQANNVSEQRRVFSEAVLSGVSAGVVGLDGEGRIRMMNEPAARLLGLDPEASAGRALVDAAPEFKELFQDASYDPALGVERPVRMLRGGEELELLARITTQRGNRRRGGEGGFVVTLDDVTELVSAQRLAAWGDVARRIAHEIKNPLTPIQLSAERLKRKYAKKLGEEEAESFERYTETIVRQTAEIGRMVDAFARFAKMPSPSMTDEPVFDIVRQAVALQEEGRTSIRYELDTGALEAAGVEPKDLISRCDRGQLHQALTNLLQNAADSIEARVERDAREEVSGAAPMIKIELAERHGSAEIKISDNGIGLPTRDRRRLLEPYVTTREKGTGLGLAIVSKIIEEHHGGFELGDAAPFGEGENPGAAARILLPLTIKGDAGEGAKSAGAAPLEAAEQG